ncbi:LANO_0E06348g1_1 [Lachancea nothofagi CBS 11611]|uniref:Hsp70 nucleotide exchange factor FES1 n=1 Tax=Lachancea nothofagi CBS 11611 TaxID=1266666 RepID=A0A1G4JTR3_9SACH|nr:LANO_0E06348g1_1 [Lachancea nothofagi CBS 11611]
MDKLLHWSVANSQGDKEAVKKIGQPDPKLLQQLFGGGPDEPALMKHAMVVITNPEAELEAKLIAFDNFEMLIENLDNANNIENLKLWEPLIGLLKSPEPELRAFALSVVGTAVQNNQKSQENFLSYEHGLPQVIEIANNADEKADVRTKAFYALSNLVRHNKDSYERLNKLGGLNIIAPVLKDQDTTDKLKLRALALITAIMTSTAVDETFMNTIRKTNIMESTLKFLNAKSNIYIIDRVLNFLTHLINAGEKFSDQEIAALKTGFQDIETVKDRLNEDDYETVKHVL